MFAFIGPALAWMLAHESLIVSVAGAIKAAAPLIHDVWGGKGPVTAAIDQAAPELKPKLHELATSFMEHIEPGSSGDAAKLTAAVESMTRDLFERSFFTPQDPRFDRGQMPG